MKTKLIILGCGNSTGVPRIDGFWGNCDNRNNKNVRTRCSAAIIRGRNSILIDTSPDIKNQLLNNKIRNPSSVIFTHEHSDQTNGLFELRPFFWKNKKRINIYGTSKTIKLLRKRFDYCFSEINKYPPFLKANLIKKKFNLGHSKEKIYFKTVSVNHGHVKSIGYIFKKTAYISDCNDLSIIEMKVLKNLKYLIIDCLKINRNYAHFNLNECLYIHNKLRPQKTILTNLHYDLDYNFLLRTLPKNVYPAYDGMQLIL